MTPPPAKRILFHHDFDGICAAAVLLRFFGHGVEVEPVDYVLRATWPSLRLSETAIVDFLFHPDATWWFDHHVTSFISPQFRKLYTPSPSHRWDTRFLSCPPLVLGVLSEQADIADLVAIFREWVRWSDIIDGARYESAGQAIFGQSACITINNALNETSEPSLRIDLVQRIAKGDSPVEIAESEPVRALALRFVDRQADALNQTVGHLHRCGSVGLVDITDTSLPFSRYAAYIIDPDILYSITAYDSHAADHRYRVSLSASPWRESGKNVVNMGALARQYGGGGRASVGSIAFDSQNDCRRVARELARDIDRGEILAATKGRNGGSA